MDPLRTTYRSLDPGRGPYMDPPPCGRGTSSAGAAAAVVAAAVVVIVEVGSSCRLILPLYGFWVCIVVMLSST
jgi:hypothetical protein